MFDLNKAIARWRTKLAARRACGKSDLDELEAHLRDEIENLTALTLSEEESFLVAKHRLGHPASLAREFAKVNPVRSWCHRAFWITLGLVTYFLLAHFASNVVWEQLELWNPGAGIPTSVVIHNASLLGLLAAVFFALYRAAKSDLRGLSLAWTGGKHRTLLSFVSGLLVLAFTLYSARFIAPGLIVSVFPPSSPGPRFALVRAVTRLLTIMLPAAWTVLVIGMRPLKLQTSEE